jgi:hypothetical protein
MEAKDKNEEEDDGSLDAASQGDDQSFILNRDWQEGVLFQQSDSGASMGPAPPARLG